MKVSGIFFVIWPTQEFLAKHIVHSIIIP